MSTLLDTIADEIEDKVRKSLVEQDCKLTKVEVDEIVEQRVHELAKRLVQVFDLEN